MPLPGRLSVLHRSAAPRGRSQERMAATAVRDLRERLDRLGGAPRPQPRPQTAALPRGFEAVPTPYGDAMLREDVIPLPPLDPHPGAVAYLDTETTGLNGGAGTYVFAAAVARPIDCGLLLGLPLLPPTRLRAAVLLPARGDLEAAAG